VLGIIKIVGLLQCFSWESLHGVLHALRIPSILLTIIVLLCGVGDYKEKKKG
jgi:hypothetical protein